MKKILIYVLIYINFLNYSSLAVTEEEEVFLKVTCKQVIDFINKSNYDRNSKSEVKKSIPKDDSVLERQVYIIKGSLIPFIPLPLIIEYITNTWLKS